MISRMFARKARTHRTPVPRLRLDRLEDRDVPATWNPDPGSDFLASNPDNWDFGYGESIEYFRHAGFNSDNTLPCLDFSGDFDAINVNPGYTGTITLNGDLTVVMFYQGDGTIDQPLGSGSEIFVTQWWGWEGGTLNSTSTTSSITVDGSTYGWAMANISPTNAGTLETGSKIRFLGGTMATIDPGTLSFALGIGMVVQNSSVTMPVSYAAETRIVTKDGVDPNEGNRIFLDAGSSYRVIGQNDFTRRAIASTRLPIYNSGGHLSVEGGTNFTIRGVISHNTLPGTYHGALYQVSGTTDLQNGGLLHVDSGVQILGGNLRTISNPVLLPPDQQFFTIQGDLRVDQLSAQAPTNVYIDYAPAGQAHVPGMLEVKGNVRWTGGTYRPWIDIANQARADLWHATGTFTLSNTVTVSVNAENFDPNLGIAATFRAKVLYAKLGFTGENGAAAPNPQLTLQAGVNLTWFILSDTNPNSPQGKWFALGPTS